MANFFSASQEEQQEIILSFWQRFKYLFIGFFVLLIVFIVGRDYLNDSRDERELKTSILFQQYLESDANMPSSGSELLEVYPETLYADFVRLNQAKKEFAKGEKDNDLQALIFDSVYNPFRGIETYFRVIDGSIKKNQKIKFF